MSNIVIEIKATEIANAINNLAAAIAGTSNIKSVEPQPQKVTEPTKAVAAAESVEEDNTRYTIEDVRAAFSTYAKKNGKDKAKEVLAKFSASKVTELNESDYAAIISIINS